MTLRGTPAAFHFSSDILPDIFYSSRRASVLYCGHSSTKCELQLQWELNSRPLSLVERGEGTLDLWANSTPIVIKQSLKFAT